MYIRMRFVPVYMIGSQNPLVFPPHRLSLTIEQKAIFYDALWTKSPPPEEFIT